MIQPQPNDAFEWTPEPAPALVCKPLLPFADHIFTSRLWRLGTAERADDEDGWLEVVRSIGIEPSHLLRARQVHGAAVVSRSFGQPAGPRVDADILTTIDPGLVPAVQTADCVPILLVDTRTGAVAAAHAGWRGLVQRVPHVTIEAMVEQFGTRESKLVAAVGPSIGPCCYEVGPDVRDRFAAAGFGEWDLGRWFSREARSMPGNPPLPNLNPRARDGHAFLDLWAAAGDQLRAAGVREDRIFVAGLCTASHPDVFCSYRRDGAGAGRMAAAIKVRS
jgi:YfiH family protein